MVRVAITLVGMVLVFAAGLGVALGAKPPEPPGKDPCSHGNSGKPCRPDPQPDHGADCDAHGKGGRNEDHCLPTSPPTTTTTTTTTSTTTGTTTTGPTTTSPPPPPPPTTTSSTPIGGDVPGTIPETTTTQTTTSSPEPSPRPKPRPKPRPRPPRPLTPPVAHRKPPPVCPVAQPHEGPCSVQGSG